MIQISLDFMSLKICKSNLSDSSLDVLCFLVVCPAVLKRFLHVFEASAHVPICRGVFRRDDQALKKILRIKYSKVSEIL